MIPVHPLAAIFPAMEGAAFDALKSDIETHGLREPITLWRGSIIDGRNRYRALCELGRVGQDWTAKELADCAFARIDYQSEVTDLLSFVISRNLVRRHLDESQRALVAARLATMGHGGKRGEHAAGQAANLPVEGSREDVGPRVKPEDDAAAALDIPAAPAVTQAGAAALLNVSERSVRSARRVLFTAPAELIGEVERGEVAVSAVAERLERVGSLQGQTQGESEDVGARDKPGHDAAGVAEATVGAPDLLAQYRALEAADRARKVAAKKEKRAAREQALGARIAAGNDGLGALAAQGRRYGVILADPEWRFEPWSRTSGMDRSPDNHYPTSATDVIAARPVATIAAEDCVLFLWATAPMLPDALAVMAAWGFGYKTHQVWRKDQTGTGYWFRNRHELLLVGTRGAVVAPAMGTQAESVMDAPVGPHSAKPGFAHAIIEAYFPTLPKIELNARAARPGWDIWGAEAPDAGAEGEGAARRRVDPDGEVVQGEPDIVFNWKAKKGNSNAQIELHEHSDGSWMWATSYQIGDRGGGYKVGPKWGNFGATATDALRSSVAELNQNIESVARSAATDSKPSAVTAIVFQIMHWAMALALPQPTDLTPSDEEQMP